MQNGLGMTPDQTILSTQSDHAVVECAVKCTCASGIEYCWPCIITLARTIHKITDVSKCLEFGIYLSTYVATFVMTGVAVVRM